MPSSLYYKYLWLADTIYRARRITYAKINEKWLDCDLSEEKPLLIRTFHNHRIAVEQLLNINILCDEHTNEYYIEDVDVLQGDTIYNWLLNSFSVGAIVSKNKDIANRIILEDTPSSHTHLSDFLSAIRESKVLNMIYHPYWSNVPLNIKFHPYFVKLFRRRWYVYGTTDDNPQIRVYALDRVLEITVTIDQYSIPREFSPMEHLYNSIGIIKDENEPCEIMIKAYGDSANYLRSLPLHHSQEDIGDGLFKYYIAPTDDFLQEVLHRREYIEVISPDSVRKKIKEIIIKLNKYYE